MPFKKLNELLLEKIASLGLEEPTPLQKVLIPKIKSGANLFAVGAKGSGKTEALVISVLQRIQMQATGDNPIALIYAKDKEAVLALAARFNKYTEFSEMRIRTVFEEQNINQQKDEVYRGADVVITTPKRMSKLYFLNGINLMELQMIIVEDAEFLVGTSFHTHIDRISESIQKCQHIVFAEKYDSKLERLRDLFMRNAQVSQ
ncbi:MAG: superfamily II DNA/RNA helicase [Crocinitomix sp.]|jgi:superfamily II DNA/RNA helicase